MNKRKKRISCCSPLQQEAVTSDLSDLSPFSSSLAMASQSSRSASAFASAQKHQWLAAAWPPPAALRPLHPPGTAAGGLLSVSMATGSGVSETGDVTSDVSDRTKQDLEEDEEKEDEEEEEEEYLQVIGRWVSSSSCLHKLVSSLARCLWMAPQRLNTPIRNH